MTTIKDQPTAADVAQAFDQVAEKYADKEFRLFGSTNTPFPVIRNHNGETHMLSGVFAQYRAGNSHVNVAQYFKKDGGFAFFDHYGNATPGSAQLVDMFHAGSDFYMLDDVLQVVRMVRSVFRLVQEIDAETLASNNPRTTDSLYYVSTPNRNGHFVTGFFDTYVEASNCARRFDRTPHKAVVGTVRQLDDAVLFNKTYLKRNIEEHQNSKLVDRKKSEIISYLENEIKVLDQLLVCHPKNV